MTTGHATGVDYSSVSVEETGKLNEAFVKEGKLTVLEASVEKLPFKDDTFDKIITVEKLLFLAGSAGKSEGSPQSIEKRRYLPVGSRCLSEWTSD